MEVRHLGYACENYYLRHQDTPIRTSRTMRKRTFNTRGMKYVNQLCEQNLKDLLTILEWNYKNGIRLFRISSDLLPWKTHWRFEDLPDNSNVVDLLVKAGEYATKTGQRLTFHPDHFVKLGSPDKKVVRNSIKDLTMHNEILDAMFPNQKDFHYNTINIHIGATYGDKKKTCKRFINHYKGYLPYSIREKLTVENDDKKALYSTLELFVQIHSTVYIPIMFDFHHYRVNPDPRQTEKEAANLAILSWGKMTPIFHWSESRRDEYNDPKIRENAHSDLCYGPLPTYNLSMPVDLMIEAKHKEQSINLIKYANGTNVHKSN